jgi:hypothetical protein
MQQQLDRFFTQSVIVHALYDWFKRTKTGPSFTDICDCTLLNRNAVKAGLDYLLAKDVILKIKNEQVSAYEPCKYHYYFNYHNMRSLLVVAIYLECYELESPAKKSLRKRQEEAKRMVLERLPRFEEILQGASQVMKESGKEYSGQEIAGFLNYLHQTYKVKK